MPSARTILTAGTAAAVIAAATAACGSGARPTTGASGSGPTATRARTTDAVRTDTSPNTRTRPAGAPAPAATRLARVTLSVPAGNRAAPLGASHTLTLPRGWRAEAWARVDGARMEAWTPQHALLVSSSGSGTVDELTPDRADPAAPPRERTLVAGLTDPQGLAFDRVGGREVLYVAESDELDRYVWNGAGVGPRTVLVHGLPDTTPPGDDVHRLKNVVVGPDHTIYVMIGSSSNATPPQTPRGQLPRASVVAFHPDGRLERVWATGARNGEGLSFAPDGTLWTAVNERDDIPYPFHRAYGGHADADGQVIQGYVNDHPPDEVARLTPGRNLGWPYCDPDPDVHQGRAGTAYRYTNLPFTPDAQTNPNGKRLDCSTLPRLQVGLPAHSAPLGFHFLAGSALPAPWSNGAVVAAHGSWDRRPPRPPVVYWMPWNARTRTLGAATVLVGGFQDRDGSRWGRPTDAVAGPDGALYVADDQAGAVYRIVAPGRG